MKSFVLLHQGPVDLELFLHQFFLRGTRALPCHEPPVPEGAFLQVMPSELDSEGQVAAPAAPALDGHLRIPLSLVLIIVDSKDARAMGFLDSSHSQ